MKVDKLKDHNVSPLNSYLFDTNVWIYIYGPMAGSEKKKQSLYAGLLRDIVDRKAGLFITSMVLSEYINRVLRIEFEQWKKRNNLYNADYKRDYRPTEDFQDTLDDVKAQVKDILSNITQKRPDDFNNIDIDGIVNSMSNFADFNDAYLVRCCERGNMCFVSDDKDINKIQSSIRLIQA